MATPVFKVSEAAAPAGEPMVRLEKLMLAPAASTAWARSMVTVSFLPGMPVGLQLLARFQAL
ncbi:MAG: hypothetical protein HY924_00960, partial [Elusimicrobia bacterium]|nr:hypothetical protein [Elusimicrobiota bacterium]